MNHTVKKMNGRATSGRATSGRATLGGLLLAALALPGAAGAAQHALLAQQAGDLSARALVAPEATQKSAGASTLRHESVTLSWAAEGAIDAAPPAPFVARSREYYIEATGAELSAGVAIPTSAPHALVRLQPLVSVGPREDAAIHPLSLVLRSPAGRDFDAGGGMEMLVSADKLAKADVPFAAGTSAFRIDPALGAGSFRLQAKGLQDGDRYLINVVEPESALALTLRTDASLYLHGQQLLVLPDLVEGDGALRGQHHRLSRFDGFVTSPAGRRFPVDFRPGPDGLLQARLVLDADEAPSPGLWEVHGQGQAQVAGRTVIRSVRLAFPVAMPVARLSGAVAVQGGPTGLNLDFGVETGAAGRYEVRGLLYGTVAGELKPVGVAQAAAWLEPGRRDLTLNFAPALLDGAAAPFELRDLNLLDQGRMGVLHRQRRALVIEEGEIVRAPARPAGAAQVSQPALAVKRTAQTDPLAGGAVWVADPQ